MEKDIRKELGNKAKELRQAGNKTQQDLAEIIGVYRGDISTFENHGSKLGIDKINALFEALGYSLGPVKKNEPAPSM